MQKINRCAPQADFFYHSLAPSSESSPSFQYMKPAKRDKCLSSSTRPTTLLLGSYAPARRVLDGAVHGTDRARRAEYVQLFVFCCVSPIITTARTCSFPQMAHSDSEPLWGENGLPRGLFVQTDMASRFICLLIHYPISVCTS